MNKKSGLALVVVVLVCAALLVLRRGSPPDFRHTYDDPAEADAYSLIAAVGLDKDVDALIAYVDEVHPDPYAIILRSEFLDHAEGLKTDLAARPGEDIVRLDCYYLFQKLIATLRDEHTYFDFHDDWEAQVQNRFPVEFTISGSRAFVASDHEADIPTGAEILGINGRLMAGLLNQARELANQTLPHYRDQVIEERFDVWSSTYLDLTPPWTVDFGFEGSEGSVTISSASSAAPAASAREYELYSESELMVEGVSVPVMTIPKFYYPDREAYDEFVHDFFSRHADAGDIVIDLRDNPGGSGQWALQVLDYLIDEPYVTHRRFDFKISQPFVDTTYFYADYAAYHRGIPQIMRRWSMFRDDDDYWLEKVLGGEVGAFVLEHDAVRNVAPDHLVYRGNVYLLISHRTNSAAVVFAAIFQDRNVGVIVGRESGGRTTFTSDPISVELPISHLRLQIPTAILDLPGGSSEHGVLPEVVTSGDALETVAELITDAK